MLKFGVNRVCSFACGLLLAVFIVSAETFQILPDRQSEFALNVKKTGLMSGKMHHFVFRNFLGTVNTEPDVQVSFIVQANSIECQDDWVKPSDREKIKRYALDEMLERPDSRRSNMGPLRLERQRPDTPLLAT